MTLVRFESDPLIKGVYLYYNYTIEGNISQTQFVSRQFCVIIRQLVSLTKENEIWTHF